MKIEDGKSISQLQKEFQAMFPFLKIEFYQKAHGDHAGSPNKDLLGHDLIIGDIRKVNTEGDLVIRPEMSAQQLEDEFAGKYGLNVQVFRRSGPSWLQTIVTDSWTLKNLNEKAKISVNSYTDLH